MTNALRHLALLSAALFLSAGGCANYRLGTAVPPELRSVAAPVFENSCGQPKAEVYVTQAVLDEFRREGTMKIADREDAALRVVGRIVECRMEPVRYDHDNPYLAVEYSMTLVADVRVVEQSTGKVMVNLRDISGSTIFRTRSDLPSTKRDAMPHAAAMLAKAIVRETVNAW
jgi:hypothetical protein